MTAERRPYGGGPLRMLDEQEVAEMRRRRAEGWKRRELAAAYGVSVRTVVRYLHDEHHGWDRSRVASVVRDWARRFAIDASAQEQDALVAAIVRVRWFGGDDPS